MAIKTEGKDTIFDPSLNQYFQEIGAIPLLTAQRERELAGRIQGGDNQALEEFVGANLRLVAAATRDFVGQPTFDRQDAIQELNFILLRVARRFNPDRARFATFATPRLRGEMKRLIAREHEKLPPSGPPLSLSTTEADDDGPLARPQSDHPDPEEEAVRSDLRGRLRRVIYEKLTSDRDRLVFALRFEGDWTLKRIGEVLGIKYQAVQQIIDKGLKKIDTLEVREELAGFTQR